MPKTVIVQKTVIIKETSKKSASKNTSKPKKKIAKIPCKASSCTKNAKKDCDYCSDHRCKALNQDRAPCRNKIAAGNYKYCQVHTSS